MIDLGQYDARSTVIQSRESNAAVFRRHKLRLELMRHRELYADDRYASSRGLRGEVIAKIELERQP